MSLIKSHAAEEVKSVDGSQVPEAHEIPPPSHLIMAFLIIFLPLLAIPIILGAFVWYSGWKVIFPPLEQPALPLKIPDIGSYWYTTISQSKVLLTSSWSSNIAQFAVAPFMFLFSFLVAYKLESESHHSEEHRAHAKKLLGGDQNNLFEWLKGLLQKKNEARQPLVRFSAIGSMIAVGLTLLLLAGDKTLMGLMKQQTFTIYDTVSPGTDWQDSVSDTYANFVLNSTLCDTSTIVSDPYNLSISQPPCSINSLSSPWNVADPPTTYRLLASGMTNMTDSYNLQDFTALDELEIAGKSEGLQIVTHFDKRTNGLHAFVINTNTVNDFSANLGKSKFTLTANAVTNVGIDYIGTTTSMVTTCVSATQYCGMHNQTSNSTIAFNCSSMFQGTINNIPGNGVEKQSGWNSSFYQLDNGVPRPISVASQLNPFTYNVTGLVNSYDLPDLASFGDPQAADGALVAAGGEIAFALSCTSTVYNVNYSMVAGNITSFNATKASGQEAAVIKAPLQVGFGTYALFQQAALAVLLTDVTVANGMSLAFSQVGLATAAGAYGLMPCAWYRNRLDVLLTKIPKAPYLFIIVLCYLYAALVLGFAIMAFMARRAKGVAARQATLVEKLRWNVRDMAKTVVMKIKALFSGGSGS